MTDRHRVTWSPAALDDLGGAPDHAVMEHGTCAAVALHQEVAGRVRSPERHPRRCRIVPELKAAGVAGDRELIIRPYRMTFRIAAVFDGRRDLDELLVLRGLRLGR